MLECNSDLYQDTLRACQQYGAYKVRRAARQQMKPHEEGLIDGDLIDVGLAIYKDVYENLLRISNIAFDLMTDEEKLDEFYRDKKIPAICR